MITFQDSASLDSNDPLPEANSQTIISKPGIFARISNFILSLFRKFSCFCQNKIDIQDSGQPTPSPERIEGEILPAQEIQKIPSGFRSSLKIDKKNGNTPISSVAPKKIHFDEKVQYRYDSSPGSTHIKIGPLMSREEKLFLEILVSNLELEKIIRNKNIEENKENLNKIVEKINLISQESGITSLSSLIKIVNMLDNKLNLTKKFTEEIKFLVVKDIEDPIDTPKSPPRIVVRTQSWNDIEL